MGNSILSLLFILGLSTLIIAYDGVKGGYRRPPESSSNIPSFPANENGTCYKRMPYDQAVIANTTGHIQLVPGSYQGVKQDSRVWVTVVDCCDGYERNPSSGKCETNCDEGCIGGTCTGPNICTCEEGWFSEQGVCKPQCRSPCQRDAYCFSPDVCQCKLGFEEDAYGQCKPVCLGNCTNGDCIAPRVCRCKPGYMLNDRHECKPICEGGCPNGECTSPGICVCHEGYVNPPGDRESCVSETNSQCRNGCQNGQCVGPDQCVCNYGYRMDPRTRNCAPSYGNHPDSYNNNRYNTEQPESDNKYAQYCRSGCPNGRCVGPEQCACNPGYQMDTRTQVCTSTGESNTETTTATSDNYNSNQQCYNGCPNGRCVGPNICICYEGFVMDQRTHSCVDYWSAHATTTIYPYTQPLQCQNGCHNGQCVGKDLCVCNPGYQMDSRTQSCIQYDDHTNRHGTRVFQPGSDNQYGQSSQCPNGCQNGRCVGPNQCVCYPGYHMDPRTRVCTYGSEGTNHASTADNMSSENRQCRNGCQYGQCVGPDQCICNTGYQMDPRTQSCKPAYGGNTDSPHYGASTPYSDTNNHRPSSQCRNGCQNGQCVGPNQCICNSGYQLDSRTQTCAPESTTQSHNTHTYYPDLSNIETDSSQCPDGCRNGQCLGPYQCVCNPGYRKDPRTRVCTPSETTSNTSQNPHSPQTDLSNLCRNDCRYGRCVGPDQCVCNQGYRMDPRTQTCRPYYRGPDSDQARRPESTSQYGPSSSCPDGCRNGQCVGPNQCVCNEGYRKDPRTQICTFYGEDTHQAGNEHRESSQCRDGCRNGQCVNNQCVCSPGYRMDSRIQTCRPYGGSHDTYNPQTPPDSRYGQANQCHNGCQNGQCVGPNQCVCNPGYQMDSRTQTCVQSYGSHSRDPNNDSNPESNNPYGHSHQCRDGCPNGQCVGHNQCICNRGYIMNPRTQTCIPSRTEESWGVEYPSDLSTEPPNNSAQCRDGCPNGQCVGPNQCVCNPGYKVHPSTNKCELSYNTDTSRWNTPESSGSQDETSCDKPCYNGRCTGQNQCTCNRGYANDEHDESKCVPVCRGGCMNGVCTAPNYCICNPGYTKDRSVKGSQKCIPSEY